MNQNKLEVKTHKKTTQYGTIVENKDKQTIYLTSAVYAADVG